MYSSALGGIVTDPAMMAVPIDDHLVHRGHCVFDTCNVHGGKAYGIDFHLDRLFSSAAVSRIERIPPRDELKSAILATLAVAGEPEGVFARFWLSAGRGDFSVSPRELVRNGAIGDDRGAASFYAVVHRYSGKGLDASGIHEATVAVPLKPKVRSHDRSALFRAFARHCHLVTAAIRRSARRARLPAGHWSRSAQPNCRDPGRCPGSSGSS
jgi:4-amino-4-deoxychorismate lyase